MTEADKKKIKELELEIANLKAAKKFDKPKEKPEKKKPKKKR